MRDAWLTMGAGELPHGSRERVRMLHAALDSDSDHDHLSCRSCEENKKVIKSNSDAPKVRSISLDGGLCHILLTYAHTQGHSQPPNLFPRLWTILPFLAASYQVVSLRNGGRLGWCVFWLLKWCISHLWVMQVGCLSWVLCKTCPPASETDSDHCLLSCYSCEDNNNKKR